MSDYPMSKYEKLAALREQAINKWIGAKGRQEICDEEIARLQAMSDKHKESVDGWAKAMRKAETAIRELADK